MQKIQELECLIPLYLEGDALALYLEMDESEQSSAESIEAKLKEAFTDGIFTAFAKLVQLRWTGQQVDVYANELRRLAMLAGFVDEGLEQIVRLSFINGFPDSISVALQQVTGIETMTMSEIISKARTFTNKMNSSVVAAAMQKDEQHRPRPMQSETVKPKGGERWMFKGKCFRCGGPHMARFCKEPIICYKCNKAGHMSHQCDQGNERGATVAPAATPLQE